MPPENIDMPVVSTPVVPEPMASVVVPKRSFSWGSLFGVLLVGVSLLAIYFYSQIPGSDEKNEVPTPTVTVSATPTVITTTIVVTLPVTTSVTPTPTVAITKAIISGTLGYPSESVPTMSVCAVDTTTKKETCVSTKAKQDKYQLSVNPGTYLVYARAIFAGSSSDYRSYYTKCDTYKDSFIPECNPNAGPEEDNGKWNSDTFICYNDPVCKAAFTPLAITVKAGEKKSLSTILQGWYIPCSYDGATCNSPTFDVWKDYMK